MSDWLYHPDNSPPLSSTIGYYSPWHPYGLPFTQQRRRSFLNFILQMPKLRVPDAMKLAMFSDEDIADLGLRRFLQRALPGGTVKAMKAHLGAFLPPQTTAT
jgi:hypothetical protein